ncbi:MAG: CAP domain-containing protein [Bradymonadaceae bacterium]
MKMNRWMGVLAGLVCMVWSAGCGGMLEFEEDWNEPVIDAAVAPTDLEFDEDEYAEELVQYSQELTAYTAREAELDFIKRINKERTNRGLKALKVCGEVRTVARKWSTKMAVENKLYHNPNFGSQIPQWTVVAENVGRGTNVSGLHSAFMNSAGHRKNILDSRFTQIGLGVEVRDGRMWVTQNFRRPSSGASCAAKGQARPVVVRDGRWFMRYSLLGGSTDRAYNFGRASDIPVMGDWNRNGLATVGVFRNGTWHIRNPNSGGTASKSFTFGAKGDKPIVGDWNGDGRQTVGFVRGNTWHLRNSNSAGPADIVFKYGRSTDKPVVGDWNGNGRQTPGVVRGNTWHLRNFNSAGSANITFDYGRSTDKPVVGDWNGNGKEQAGLVRGNTWYMRGVGYQYKFGRSTDRHLIARQ